jgi:Uma2 family endonuclease
VSHWFDYNVTDGVHSVSGCGMSLAITAPPGIRNLADLVERLGNVPLDRIRFQPLPGTATVEDVVRIEERENRLCELVDGVLVEKTMGFQEGRIAILLATALQNFVEPGDLGVVTGPDGMIRFPDNLVRMPDVAFAAWERFPNDEIPAEPVPEIVPDLAVEILSPGNTRGEMSRKLREYFNAGVRLVWFVDPKAKTVTVHTSPGRSKVLPTSGTLDGGKVLPGFEMPVANLFVRLKRKPRKKS